MENTDADQQPTPGQAEIIERLRLMQAEVDAVKTDLVDKLHESREQVDSLFRELSKVRDELITSKTERRVLSRWYEDAKAERDKLHGELVEVRAALADVSAERDSLRTTIAAWEAADTAPFLKVPDVADHVMPPILHVGEPDPANDAKDAKLEFRNVVPTPEMIAHVGYWDLVSGAAAIAFRSGGLRIVFWRIAGSQEWRTDPCPQPLKPHGMTWQQLDRALANTKSVPPVLPLCNVCHGCGTALTPYGTVLRCPNQICGRTTTGTLALLFNPYHDTCKSTTPVRHE